MLTEILKENGVYQAKNIEYQTAVNDAQFQLISGNYEFALLAEPALSATKMKLKSELNKDLFIIADLQALYQEMTGLTSYPQAGLFIEQGFYKKNKTFVEAFLDAVANSAAFVNDNHETAATYYQEAYELGTIPTNIPIPVLKNAIVGSNIGFVNAADSQESMNQYLEMIYRINPNLVGGKMVDEGFYLKK
jgi:NitT/TauT family transport system substrate-binding protein